MLFRSNANKDRLQIMLSDKDPNFVNLNCMIIPGVKVEFSLLGIAGFRTFQVFAVKNLPEPYKDNAIFQIQDVRHTISGNNWETSITAGVRPLNGLQGII